MLKSFIKETKNKVVPVLKQYDISRAAIFGSYANGKYKKDSDVDILIKFKKGKEKSLLGLVKIKFELERQLKKKVDLVTLAALSPYIKNHILKTMKIIYEK